MSSVLVSYHGIALVLPSFTERPTDITTAETKSVVLPCTANGFPTPTITWYKEGVAVTWHPQLESGALFIGSVDATDEGKYVCVAVNTAEYKLQTSMRLTVQGACKKVLCNVAFDLYYVVGNMMCRMCRKFFCSV